MHHIHIRVMDKIPEVMVGLQVLSELLLPELHAFAQMLRIHITDSHKPAPAVTGEMV